MSTMGVGGGASWIPYQVDHKISSTGKHIAITKRKVRWHFGFMNPAVLYDYPNATDAKCRGSEHEIELVWSVASGKYCILLDNHEIQHNVTPPKKFPTNTTQMILHNKLEHCFSIPSHLLPEGGGYHEAHIVAYATKTSSSTSSSSSHQMKQFDLILDGLSYSNFLRIYQLGTPEMRSAYEDNSRRIVTYRDVLRYSKQENNDRYFNGAMDFEAPRIRPNLRRTLSPEVMYDHVTPHDQNEEEQMIAIATRKSLKDAPLPPRSALSPSPEPSHELDFARTPSENQQLYKERYHAANRNYDYRGGIAGGLSGPRRRSALPTVREEGDGGHRNTVATASIPAQRHQSVPSRKPPPLVREASDITLDSVLLRDGIPNNENGDDDDDMTTASFHDAYAHLNPKNISSAQNDGGDDVSVVHQMQPPKYADGGNNVDDLLSLSHATTTTAVAPSVGATAAAEGTGAAPPQHGYQNYQQPRSQSFVPGGAPPTAPTTTTGTTFDPYAPSLDSNDPFAPRQPPQPQTIPQPQQQQQQQSDAAATATYSFVSPPPPTWEETNQTSFFTPTWNGGDHATVSGATAASSSQSFTMPQNPSVVTPPPPQPSAPPHPSSMHNAQQQQQQQPPYKQQPQMNQPFMNGSAWNQTHQQHQYQQQRRHTINGYTSYGMNNGMMSAGGGNVPGYSGP